MSAILTNVRSFLPKKEAVEALLDDNCTDLAVFTESWLTPDVDNHELLHSTSLFTTYRRDRVGRRGGGVLVFVKSSIESNLLTTSCEHEILCIRISLPTCTNILIACYRAPDCDRSFIEDISSVVLDLVTRFPRANLILCGDLNFPDIDWTNFTAHTQQSRDFLEFALLYNFTQSVNEPTRGLNTLDLILTSNPELIQSVSCANGLSDHSIVLFNISSRIPRRQPLNKYIRDYNKADFSLINEELEQFYLPFNQSAFTRSVNENWLLFKNKILTLVDRHVPLVCIRGDADRPWYSNTIRKLSRKKKRLFRAAKKSPSPSKWEKYLHSLHEYTAMLRRSKKKYFHNDLWDILRTKPKKFWRLLGTKNAHSNSIPLVDSDGSPTPKDQCPNVLNSYFTSVFTCEPSHDTPTLRRSDYSEMPPIEITTEGIIKLINNLQSSSAPGPDNIPAKILKATNTASSRFLQIIFTQSISEGTIPDDWKLSKVTPVFKSGHKSDPSNYRPIALTCIACKLLEHIIYSHTAAHLDNNNFFFHNQHGFRRGFSCETQLFQLTTDLNLNLDSSFQTDVIFIDFSKAFDRVPHQRLISKLSCLCLHPLILSWIRCFLTDRSQFTTVAGRQSRTTTVTSGVPQGSVLGPLLFLIYINDLPSGISSSIRLFADDCVLYRKISSKNDQLLLQNDLIHLENWCSLWMMQLNVSKCKFMHVTRKHSPDRFTYSVTSTDLSRVETYRYLGVLLNSKLTWSDHIQKLAADASKILGYIRRSLSCSPARVRQLAYTTFVRAKLDYASAIWNPHQTYLTNSLESIQNRAARFISSTYGFPSSISAIKSSLGLPTLVSRRKIARLCLFHKLYYTFPDMHTSLLLPPLRTSRRLHNSMSKQRLYGSTNAFNKSFLPIAIEEWNNLPESIATERDPNKFKMSLTVHVYN